MIKLIQGDCLERMLEIPDGSIDMILTDPPYGTTACKWDSVIPLEPMWKQLKRIIKKNGAIVLFGAEPFSSTLRISNKDYKYDWIWEKNTGTNFLHAKRMPIRFTENIHVFIEGSSWYYPQKTTGHAPTNSGVGRNTGNVYSGNSKVNYKGGDTTRFPKNIIEFKSVNNYKRIHPTEKPVDLMEYLIKTYTNESETVVDFTMGSSTTAIASLNTNRNFIGIEKDENYFNIGVNRVKEHIECRDLKTELVISTGDL